MKGIITIDGNNKDDPEAIPHFIESLNKGIDFVQASRFIKGGKGRKNVPLYSKYSPSGIFMHPFLVLHRVLNGLIQLRDIEVIVREFFSIQKLLHLEIYLKLMNC